MPLPYSKTIQEWDKFDPNDVYFMNLECPHPVDRWQNYKRKISGLGLPHPFSKASKIYKITQKVI